ncbi:MULTISPECIES: histidine phosphatase family protein [unclassified Shewanella]|uniref:histidine phosphatase family protein n=1 Tax=unclassified Shewanella TaxID=196818 RepID=UPI001BC4F2AE|nr:MULTISPECIES: histidine phosphatase family protein [unclassified Shewanella]GIU17021.1 hypothetical protein TUM4444_30400 [Shewanella sp. MBTL60-112-B1]GIU38758.1 hypothetical protein TUM4445_33420 [Shewanella sp. MBTL60-112-B2]
MSYTQFTLLRHGLPEKAECLLGRTNPPLTAQGWQQMQQSLGATAFDLIVSSPLIRCQSFAQHLADNSQCQLIIDDAWQELDFGLWDGKSIAELWQGSQQTHSSGPKKPLEQQIQQPQTYSDFWHAPFEHTPPEGESSLALLQRISVSIESLSRQHQGKHLLIITHSGVMRMVLAKLLNSTLQGNPHLSRISLEHAALLHFNTYLDADDHLWPQLQGFHNPSFSNASVSNPTVLGAI